MLSPSPGQGKFLWHRRKNVATSTKLHGTTAILPRTF